MEVYRNYDRIIKKWSEKLSPWHSLVYCLAICKRSAPLYYDFVDRENWGEKEVIFISHELLKLAVNGVRFDAQILKNCLKRLESGIPHTEDFEDCSDALDAGIIHLSSAELLIKHNAENVYFVARSCYDVVARQIRSILLPNGVVTTFFQKESERHEFIQAEINWQNRVREELSQIGEHDTDNAEAKISEWIKTPLLR